MSRRPRPSWSEQQLSYAWQSASLLLGYPDERLLDQDLPVVRAAAAALPATLGAPLRRVADALTERPLADAQAEYVETFDTRRRCNLFLTYFAHGDTRKRGVALLRFKQTYLRSGYVLDDAELPDHLCVVLEYAATVDRTLGWRLLLDHRAGLELLRMALLDDGSPWAGALEAVCATLPPLRGDEHEAVLRLAAEGPPAEEVGLTPYGTPAFDATLAAATAAVATGTGPGTGPDDLPMPTMPSRRGARA